MEKLGFSKEYIQFVEIIYKDNSSIITNNGFLSQTVMMLRGLRQGCPLSLPLYVIQGEVTAKNINNDNTIIGLKIPNSKKQLKILQYADDSNFFLQDQNSVKNVIKYFQKLQNATGATINFEKTTVILINTDNSSNLSKQIKIKEQFETMKILGILFNKDLHYANQINWENIIEKMEKHISKLSTRTLSLYRKTIIINTLILSKTSFLSNVFPIDTKTTQKYIKKYFNIVGKISRKQCQGKPYF